MEMKKLLKAANEKLEKIMETTKGDEIDSVTIDTELDVFPTRLFVYYRGGDREVFDYNKESEISERSEAPHISVSTC